MIGVVCWKWKPAHAYRSTFGPGTVNTLRKMVQRHYQKPHKFFCVTDDAAGIDPAVNVIPLWDDYKTLLSPHGRGNPSCYRRLKMFSAEAASIFAGCERVCSMDLDAVVTGDLTPLLERKEDVVLWGDTNPTTPYNGSMINLRLGSRPNVWDDFDPYESPRKAKALGYFGSDQAWIGAALGPNEPKFSRQDGVYSYRVDLRWRGDELPENCRVVFFHGQWDPWMQHVSSKHKWIREHYR